MKSPYICRLAVAAALATAIAQPADDLSALVGEWKGDSICQTSGSACHNEKVIWHVAKLADKPGWVAIRGERIESGKAVAMGTLEFKWDADSRVIVSESAQGAWRLSLDGARLEGTLTRPDRTVFRRVVLRKPAAAG
jgi:hypothetical protein